MRSKGEPALHRTPEYGSYGTSNNQTSDLLMILVFSVSVWFYVVFVIILLFSAFTASNAQAATE